MEFVFANMNFIDHSQYADSLDFRLMNNLKPHAGYVKLRVLLSFVCVSKVYHQYRLSLSQASKFKKTIRKTKHHSATSHINYLNFVYDDDRNSEFP